MLAQSGPNVEPRLVDAFRTSPSTVLVQHTGPGSEPGQIENKASIWRSSTGALRPFLWHVTLVREKKAVQPGLGDFANLILKDAREKFSLKTQIAPKEQDSLWKVDKYDQVRIQWGRYPYSKQILFLRENLGGCIFNWFWNLPSHLWGDTFFSQFSANG